MLPAKIRNAASKAIDQNSVFTRALERYREVVRPVRIGFVIDATGSRADTWEQAQAVQRRMFDATARINRISVRLVHFGGARLTDDGWKSGARELAAAMAGVRCARGLTQILPALRCFVDAPAQDRARAVIVIGDSFEEDVAVVSGVSAVLKRAGVKVFSFLEGDDALAALAFRQLAEGTGGKFARFGDDLSLGDLCEAVAVLASGGEKAVRRLANNRAAALLLAPPTQEKGSSR